MQLFPEAFLDCFYLADKILYYLVIDASNMRVAVGGGVGHKVSKWAEG